MPHYANIAQRQSSVWYKDAVSNPAIYEPEREIYDLYTTEAGDLAEKPAIVVCVDPL